MRKEKHDIIQVLDPDEVTGLTDAQKKHYLSLGYQPCKLASGRIKWLNMGQQAAMLTKKRHGYSIIPKAKTRDSSTRRRRSVEINPFREFVRRNWIIILLALIIIALLCVVKYWNLIM